MIHLRYFPCDKKHKLPIGAVEKNKPLLISVNLSGGGKPFLVLTKEGEYPMYYELFHKKDDVYSCEIVITSEGLYTYCFEVQSNENIRFYADEYLNAGYVGSEWQLSVYASVYKEPAWFSDGIVYQIMTDRFFIGKQRFKTKSTMEYRDDWDGVPSYLPDEKGIYKNNDMFGGNLYGIIEKLDYLKELNVNTIYLNPIFEAHSSHKYDTADYENVDSDYGGNDALKALIDSAEKKGMRIILDGVFSHTGTNSKYFNKNGYYDTLGAYQSKDSKYYSWYRFNNFPDDYDCWWGIKIHPNVNEEDENYSEYINGENGIIRKYLKMGISGWRLDVADELPDTFIKGLTSAAKAERDDAMVLGEVWEDASNKRSYNILRKYFWGDELDSVTNYPYRKGIIEYVLTGRGNTLVKTLFRLINNYPQKTLNLLMNILSNHDIERMINTLSDDKKPDTKQQRSVHKISDYDTAKKRLKIAALLQYTLPGVPLLYYGDEAGLQGYEDPFNRLTFPWGNADIGLTKFYQDLGKLRNIADIKTGDFTLLINQNGILSYKRKNTVILINNSDSVYQPQSPVLEIITKKTVEFLAPLQFVVYQQ